MLTWDAPASRHQSIGPGLQVSVIVQKQGDGVIRQTVGKCHHSSLRLPYALPLEEGQGVTGAGAVIWEFESLSYRTSQ